MADYIDRQEVIETLAFYREDPDGIDHALNSVKSIPSADVAPVVHGKWVYDENGMDWNIPAWRCSECDTVNSALPTFCGKEKLHLFVGSKFCPQCGAKMDLLN